MHYIDHKYVRLVSGYLPGFKDAGNDVFRFRCPFCGDSKKNTIKKRGYLYPVGDSVAFKCHNCGKPLNFGDFLKLIAPSLAAEYRFEKFVEPTKRTNLGKNKSVCHESFKTETKLKSTNRILSRCIRLLDLPIDHEARLFIEKRKIPLVAQRELWYVDDINIINKSIPRYHERLVEGKIAAIVIPFFDSDGILTFIQCRALSGKFRYLTLEVEEGMKKIWGLNNVDWTKRLWIFEGPFDAMFVPNSVATAGMSSMLPEAKYFESHSKSDFVFVFDRDYETNWQVYTQLKRAIVNGYSVVIYDKHFQWNDANSAIESGWSVENLEAYLKSRTCSGLKAQLELSKFKPPIK